MPRIASLGFAAAIVGVAAEAHAWPITLPTTGVTIEDPTSQWLVVASDATGDTLQREFDVASLSVVTQPGSCARWIDSIAGLAPGARIAAPATLPSGWHDEAFVGQDGNGDLAFTLCVDLGPDRTLLATVTLRGVAGNYLDRSVPLVVGEQTRELADLLVAIERALRSPAAATGTPPPVLTPTPTPPPSYGVDASADPAPPATAPPPPYAPELGGSSRGGGPLAGFFAGRSTTRQLDLRAGVAFLDPAPSDRATATAVALGLELPLRFVSRRVAVETSGRLAYASGDDLRADLHAGAGVGWRGSWGAIAWAAGLGYDDWGTLDPELDDGAYAYTGPVLRLGNDRLAFDWHAAFLLRGGDNDGSRLRGDLATGAGARKLVVSFERATTASASAISLTVGIGLGLD